MSIQVNWTNPNDVVMDSIEIYRAAVRGGSQTLIATLDKDTLGYLDDNVTSNATYFYTVRFIKGDQFSDSIEFPLGFYTDTGPGGTSIIRGDWEFGFMGEIDAANFFSFDDVQAVAVAAAAVLFPVTKWLKFIINQRIVFIPNTYYTYNALLGSGSSGIGNGYLTVDQDSANGAVMSKGEYQYTLRLPYATTRFTTAVNPIGDYVLDQDDVITHYDTTIGKSELGAICSIIQRTSAVIPEVNGPKFSDYTVTNVSQGIVSNTYVAAPGLLFKTEDFAGTTTTLTPTDGVTTRFIWWPVIELQF